ncbi:MAG: TRAP transporter substrate-binding protein DctP [Desulfopila sp.]|jgi:TRAP-type C4-dicarboxylate transport system substrate-binding protein|nr:TRAP transporter substrate-binding protein DctP [Desulfopila sp.]
MKKSILAALIILFFFFSPALAAPKHSFKIASLAPDGSIWTNHFRQFAAEVEEKSGGAIHIKIYPGGIMGDDLAMYRKIRIGQLHGGGFTMTGISNVVPDFRVMAIPFYFDTYQEIDAVSDTIFPYLQKRFNDNDLELLAITEVGFIYGMSTSPMSTLADLQKRKSWVPAGDPLTTTYLQNLGITPIPLTIPDVLSSLQTGLIDTVYTSLYGAIVMQWFTKAVYVTDVPYGYAYGAVALSKKAFSQLPQEYAEILHQAAQKHFTALNRETREINRESKEVLKEHGVTFIGASPETKQKLRQNSEETIKILKGQAFSEEAFSQVDEIVKQLRATQ